jgi:hypothetical protein
MKARGQMQSDELYIFVFFAVIVAIILAAAAIQSRKQEVLLTRQAEKRGGQVEAGGLFGRTNLLLTYNGIPIQIYSIPGGKSRPPRTVAESKLDSPRFPSLRIARNSLWQKMLGAFGKERILSGNEEFDNKFVVTGEDTSAAHKATADDVKAKLLEFPFHSLYIDIQPLVLRVSIQSIPRDDDGYDQFIDIVNLVLQKIT